MSNQSFNKNLLILSLIIGLCIAGFQGLQHKWVLTNLVWLALLYFAFLTWITYTISNSAVSKDNKTFITRVYSAIGIRFIFSLFPLLIYLLFYPTREMPFVIAYLLLYLFYTAFEIYILVVNLRPDLKQKDPA